MNTLFRPTFQTLLAWSHSMLLMMAGRQAVLPLLTETWQAVIMALSLTASLCRAEQPCNIILLSVWQLQCHLASAMRAFGLCVSLAEAVVWCWLQRIKKRKFTGWRSNPVSGDQAVILVLWGNVSLHTVPIRLSMSPAAATCAMWECLPTVHNLSQHLRFSGGEWLCCIELCSTLFTRDSIVQQLKAPSCAAFDPWALLPAVVFVTSTVAFMVTLWTLAKDRCGWTSVHLEMLFAAYLFLVWFPKQLPGCKCCGRSDCCRKRGTFSLLWV